MIDSNTKNPIKDLIEEPKIIGEGLFDKLLSLAARKSEVLMILEKYARSEKTKHVGNN